MRRPSQPLALGALFFVIAVFFAGIAFTAGDAAVWPIAAAGGALAVWMLTLAFRVVLAARRR